MLSWKVCGDADNRNDKRTNDPLWVLETDCTEKTRKKNWNNGEKMLRLVEGCVSQHHTTNDEK